MVELFFVISSQLLFAVALFIPIQESLRISGKFSVAIFDSFMYNNIILKYYAISLII